MENLAKNIYEKMQLMRCEMQSKTLKKSGFNSFSKYHYFELQDIIPAINELMKKYKVSSELNFGEFAELKITNAENSDEIMLFSCPMSNANLKGCHAVQNLGASITYIRRYLYINAFEIVEHDALDSMPLDVKPNQQTPPAIAIINKAQVMDFVNAGQSSNYSPEQIKEYLYGTFGFKNSREITTDKYQEIYKNVSSGTIPQQGG